LQSTSVNEHDMCDIWLYFGEGWEKKVKTKTKPKKKGQNILAN